MKPNTAVGEGLLYLGYTAQIMTVRIIIIIKGELILKKMQFLSSS
jgi:hypothetical protein